MVVFTRNEKLREVFAELTYQVIDLEDAPCEYLDWTPLGYVADRRAMLHLDASRERVRHFVDFELRWPVGNLLWPELTRPIIGVPAGRESDAQRLATLLARGDRVETRALTLPPWAADLPSGQPWASGATLRQLVAPVRGVLRVDDRAPCAELLGYQAFPLPSGEYPHAAQIFVHRHHAILHAAAEETATLLEREHDMVVHRVDLGESELWNEVLRVSA